MFILWLKGQIIFNPEKPCSQFTCKKIVRTNSVKTRQRFERHELMQRFNQSLEHVEIVIHLFANRWIDLGVAFDRVENICLFRACQKYANACARIGARAADAKTRDDLLRLRRSWTNPGANASKRLPMLIRVKSYSTPTITLL
jgi:hypothetical protein